MIRMCVALCACVGGGCQGGPAVEVEVCGDLFIPNEIDALRLSLLNEVGDETSAGLFSLDPRVGDADGGCLGDPLVLPQSFELGNGSGQSWVLVQGLHDGIEATRVEARVEFPVRGHIKVVTALTLDCLGVRCAMGQTCVAGQCEVAQFGGTPDACAALDPRATPEGGIALCAEASVNGADGGSP